MSAEQRDGGVEETIALPSGRPVLRCIFELVYELVERGHVIEAYEDDEADVTPDVNVNALYLLTANAADVMAILLDDSRVH